MKRYLHGIHVAGHKSTAQMSAGKLPLPDSVVIPMACYHDFIGILQLFCRYIITL